MFETLNKLRGGVASLNIGSRSLRVCWRRARRVLKIFFAWTLAVELIVSCPRACERIARGGSYVFARAADLQVLVRPV